MRYEKMEPAVFLERPNRFVAYVEQAGRREICHVKNTGRCRELLVPGAELYVQRSDNPARKTALDLIAVKKGSQWVNMDSQAPNKAAAEWLRQGGLGCREITIRPEYKYGDSRFDFFLEADGRKAFMEVKGVTLEEDGIARFPDAPTERGVKHIRELIRCLNAGYEAYVFFVIQMKGVRAFEPNDRTHPAFGEALREAAKKGVQILAYDCVVRPDEMSIDQRIEVWL
ncbi:sugar fermentation stimulation protein SfsA [Lachnoclostridium sp. An131]|uniref:DNA/RNA nuclease SfsA n=1 Tax=Lachnoclostridium sp. An131 TaxID=1965555 RepID=UPI000B3AC2F2|nr:DNA/RNA nuclease SfsA [Lachnoclostridium sp. An131]OUQ28572.1 sugar fermentation stimulation protein SfsA [Lachnoclostridium sp. An131]